MTLTQGNSVLTSVLSHIGIEGGNTSHKSALTHCDPVIACMCLLRVWQCSRRCLLMHVPRKRTASCIVSSEPGSEHQSRHLSEHSRQVGCHPAWKASYAFTSIYATGNVFPSSLDPMSLLDVRDGLQFSDWHIVFEFIVFDWQVM